jgi:hypothetical protein
LRLKPNHFWVTAPREIRTLTKLIWQVFTGKLVLKSLPALMFTVDFKFSVSLFGFSIKNTMQDLTLNDL